jgi:hypothetical protein
MIIWSLSMMKNFALVEDTFMEKGRGAIGSSTGRAKIHSWRRGEGRLVRVQVAISC